MDKQTARVLLHLIKTVTNLLEALPRVVELVTDVENEEKLAGYKDSLEKTFESIKAAVAVLEQEISE